MSMTVSSLPAAPRRVPRRYLREPVPLHFPVEEQVPESRLHRILIDRLCDSLERELGETVLLSSDQFLYWDPTDPTKCLAPDVAVRLGGPSLVLKSWKTWEHGAPHLGIEIVSDMDASERHVEPMLERYRKAAIAEVVRFDPKPRRRERPLRIWDLFEGDLVERDPTDPEFLRCDTLGLFWSTPVDPKLGPTLRLARDVTGRELLPTSKEAEASGRSDVEAERVAKEAALARIAELEAALAKKP